MATFERDEDITTSEPTIEVTLTPEASLPLGPHVFQLVVRDDAGNLSQPATVVVTVIDAVAPTAVLKAPQRVRFGESFTLDGKDSTDAGGGRVARWIWTYLGPAEI